jgi:hypothetical protein
MANNTGQGLIVPVSSRARPTICKIPQLGGRERIRGKVVESSTVKSQPFLLEVKTTENIGTIKLFSDQLSYTKDTNGLN